MLAQVLVVAGSLSIVLWASQQELSCNVPLLSCLIYNLKFQPANCSAFTLVSTLAVDGDGMCLRI
jgi:hypothetical protein